MPDIEILARGYFDKVLARDAAAIGAMFAPAGVLVLPYGARFAGPAAIEAFYRDLFGRAPPMPTVRATLAQGARCLVELTARQPDGTEGHAADVFTFDDAGLISELTIYSRTGS